MAKTFPGDLYAPPGVFVESNTEAPVTTGVVNPLLPVLIGTGQETLVRSDYEVVRGSSASADTPIVDEDMTGRAATIVGAQVTLGSFDGVKTWIRVRNYPIVQGDGTATVTNDRSRVKVKVDGQEVVVKSVLGASGLVELVSAPASTAQVLCSYSFDRTDVQQTDDVSAQVTAQAATLTAEIGGPYTFSAVQSNNSFVVTSDRSAAKTWTIPDGTYTAAQLATILNTGAPGTLVASAVSNASGLSTVRLSSSEALVIGGGSANAVLGFAASQRTQRNSSFRVFNGPVTDGSGSGIATTDVSKVQVLVNGSSVVPVSVDGQNRLVVLPYAPAAGSTVSISYSWNSWQDTFDYLGDPQVLTVTACGDAPGLTTYQQGTDFLLQDSKILWGTGVATSAGVTASGSTALSATATLVDDRTYLQACTAYQDLAVSPPAVDRQRWVMAHQPTTGNGRDTPLGSTLYGAVSNGRLDLPTDRPDLVTAYWGFSLEDALDRGAVEVLEVDSATSTLRLAEPVPAGAQVWATYWYNNLTDNRYQLTSQLAGSSGIGTYEVQDQNGQAVLNARFGAKGTALSNVTVVTPSGAEATMDCRLEPVSGDLYTGPVEENVTVQFANTVAGPARFTGTGAEPFDIQENASDHLGVSANGTTFAAGGIDLSDPMGTGAGFYATLVGGEIPYTAASGSTTFVVDATTDTLTVQVDGVEISAKAEHSGTATVAAYVSALNRAAKGDSATTNGAGNVGGTTVVLANTASALDDYYIGWEVSTLSGATDGETKVVTAYNGGTKTATVGSAFSAQVAGGVTYLLSNPATRPVYKAATRFTSSLAIAAGEHDTVKLHYVGATAGDSGTLTAVVAPATYATATDLATAVEAAITTQVGGLGAGFKGLKISVAADADGRLNFKLRRAQGDASGFMEFVTGVAAADFATLAGIDTSTSGGVQAKLVDGDIARAYTVGSVLMHDRLIVRGRLVPGRGTLGGYQDAAQALIVVMAGNGNTLAGLTAGAQAAGSFKAAAKPATIWGQANWSAGQSTGVGNGKGILAVKFYSSGANRNNVLNLTVDGTTYSVTFAGSSSGVLTPLGPASDVNSVLAQIGTQAPALSSLVSLEGNGIRFTSGRQDSQSVIQVGSGSANGTLGLTDNARVTRQLVTAQEVASALMAHSHATIAAALNTWSTLVAGNYFATRALAWAAVDANQAFVAFQSLTTGTSSTLVFGDVASMNALSYGVGLGIADGDSAVGEPARNGFFVTSSDPLGSGSANTSILNSGVGQDGVVGQTYRDAVTGLTFTVLTRAGGQSYPVGAQATFTIKVSRTFTTNANQALKGLGGVELTVANTLGVTTGNTAFVQTYKRQGAEPAVGEPYYVSYQYQKQDFGFKAFTSLSDVEAAFGSVSIDNPLALGAYLAFLNGAARVGIKQINTSGSGVVTDAQIRTALDSLAGPQADSLTADMLVPCLALSDSLLTYLQKHCEVQSSKRNRCERTALVGFAAGRDPTSVIATARTLKSSLIRLVYPETLKLPLADALGRSMTYLVDGWYGAAALAGSVVSPAYDVATPWENRTLRGFSGSARTLNAATADQVAQAGVTIIEDRRGVLKVRHGLTTDLTTILTKLPTVALIDHEVHKRLRAALEPYIGIKLLPGVLNQIEGVISTVLGNLIDEQILAGYRGVKAVVAVDDPTVVEIVAAFAPIFPLLYIDARLSLRATVV